MEKKPVVFLGIGHGGSDPGCVANGIKEKEAALTIAKACRDELERHDVAVVMSRQKDENDDVTERIRECNDSGATLAVDLHLNGGGGNGAEAFHYSGGGVSKELAKNIMQSIKEETGQNLRRGDSGKNDGLKVKLNEQGKDYFGFIRQTKPPACIVEHAFLDNKDDVKIVDTAAELKAMGVADAHGILKTLDIKVKPASEYTVTVSKLTEDQAAMLVKQLKKDGYTVKAKEVK